MTPRKLQLSLLPFAILFLFTACQNDPAANYDRPTLPVGLSFGAGQHAPNGDSGLHDDLLVAYHTQTGAMYKAWKGNVNFDGAVYTTAHGPQPSSLGDGWFENKIAEPWMVSGKPAKVQYGGHRFEDAQVILNIK